MVLGIGGLQGLLPATSRHSQFMVTFYDLCWPLCGVAQVDLTHVRGHKGSGEVLRDIDGCRNGGGCPETRIL